MKNKNRTRQLTEKHSNKEVLLAGATASHQRGLFEYHSPVKNIIEFNSRETIENKLSQKWKNPSPDSVVKKVIVLQNEIDLSNEEK